MNSWYNSGLLLSKEIFLVCSFFSDYVAAKGNSPKKFHRDYLINIAACLLVYHKRDIINKNVLGWFLLMMCKDHTLTKSTNFISRNHSKLCFRLRRVVSNRVWGSWYLIIWLETTVQSSPMDFSTVTFLKLILGSDCLELFFCTVDFDSILTQYHYRKASRSQTRALNTIRYIYRL